MSKALAKRNQLETTFSFIHPPDDEIRGLNYYRDELEDTLKRFDTFKEKVNTIVERGKLQRYETEFKNMLSGHCIVKKLTITIIQCTQIIKNKECKFYENCRLRKNILELIEL